MVGFVCMLRYVSDSRPTHARLTPDSRPTHARLVQALTHNPSHPIPHTKSFTPTLPQTPCTTQTMPHTQSLTRTLTHNPSHRQSAHRHSLTYNPSHTQFLPRGQSPHQIQIVRLEFRLDTWKFRMQNTLRNQGFRLHARNAESRLQHWKFRIQTCRVTIADVHACCWPRCTQEPQQ